MDPSPSNSESNTHVRNGPLNILSLDGGGVRGLSSLLILHNLMIRLQHKRKCFEIPQPWQEFDLIIGTSTGGIVALMLGRLRLSISDAISIFRQFVKKVFGNFLAKFKYVRMLVGAPLYSDFYLVAALKAVASNCRLDDIDGCKTAVVTAQRNSMKRPVLLRSYHHPRVPADACEIWEAGRATSAASVFFPPVSLGDPPSEYIDGAFSGHCNPAELAMEEVEALWGPASTEHRSLGCLLSIGTGFPSTHSFSLRPLKILEGMAKLIADCSAVDERLTTRYGLLQQSSPYFRFSVREGLQNIQLDDWKKCALMAGLTGNYMRHPEQDDRAYRCICRLDSSLDIPIT
jgi:hypothetical protein